MTIVEFRERLSKAVKKHFPEATLEVWERRTTIFEARIGIDEETFVEIYFNALTGKQSYALISCDQRVMGYDNYKFWHCHPFGQPQKHIPCEEPTLEEVLAEMRNAVTKMMASKSGAGNF